MAHVLVIEDDSAVRLVLSLALIKAGFTVSQASDGMEGLEVFSRGGCDLVITDMVMPRMGGVETIAALKSVNPQVRIIAMSGCAVRGSSNYFDQAKELGVDHCFSKPFELRWEIRTGPELT
jgi:two-component system, NtrC family, response regulator AtoC